MGPTSASAGARGRGSRRRCGGFVDLATKQQKADGGFRWGELAIVRSHRKLWGLYLGQFCLTCTLWFFLTWFPTYLVDFRGMDFIKAGLLGSLPFLAAFAGVNCSGLLSDRLLGLTGGMFNQMGRAHPGAGRQ